MSVFFFEGQVLVGGLTGFLVITSSCNLLLLIYAFQDRLEDGPLVEVPWSKTNTGTEIFHVQYGHRVICIHGWILHIYYIHIYTYMKNIYYNFSIRKEGVQSWMNCPQVLGAVNLNNWSLRWPLQPKLWPWVLQWLENHEWVQGCGITYRVLVAGLWGWKWGLLSFLGLLGCWVGGVENLLRSFFWAAGECGFRKADWWFPNSCRVQAVQDEESTRGISKEEQPHVLHQFLNKSTNLKTHGMSWGGALKSHGCLLAFHFIGYQRPISCTILRGWQGPGGWVLWLVGWTTCAGFMQDFAGEKGSVNPRYGRGKDFWRPPMMLKSKWFHLVFFFSLSHFGLLHFSLVHKMLGGQPVGDAWALLEETNKKGQVIWMVFVGPCDFCDILMCLLAFHPSSQHTR